MIRCVRTARLRAIERQLADAQARIAEVRAGADRALTRHVAELLAAAERQRVVEAKASNEGFRADVAESDAKRLRDDIERLDAAVRELEAAPLTVYITFHDGRLHSVHATEEAAQAAAESDPHAPAGWSDWAPAPTEGPPLGWSMRRSDVHGLLNGVHDRLASVHGNGPGVHDAGEGVHGGGAGGGERG